MYAKSKQRNQFIGTNNSMSSLLNVNNLSSDSNNLASDSGMDGAVLSRTGKKKLRLKNTKNRISNDIPLLGMLPLPVSRKEKNKKLEMKREISNVYNNVDKSMQTVKVKIRVGSKV